MLTPWTPGDVLGPASQREDDEDLATGVALGVGASAGVGAGEGAGATPSPPPFFGFSGVRLRTGSLTN